MIKKLLALSLSLCLLFTAAACSAGGDGGGGGASSDDKILFGDCDWESNRFHNALGRYIVENVFDVKTEEMKSSTAIVWQSLDSGEEGDIDIILEAWSENISLYKDSIASGRVVELSVNFDDNFQGYYVPRFVIEGDAARGLEPLAPGLRTVKDLKNYAHLFPDPEDPDRGIIYGGIPGWYVTEIFEKKNVAYGLGEMYNSLLPGSEAAMTAALVSAYEAGEPWVGYYWEPTWISGKYDLVLLEDEPYDEAVYEEGLCAVPANRVTVCMSLPAVEKYPQVKEFFSNYQTSSALTASALAHMEETKSSYEETAIWFIEENNDLVKSWLSEAQFEKLMSSLR